MTQCEICGTENEKNFTVIMNGENHVFDTFKCAIQELAPLCEHCGCKVLGHGVERSSHLFCSDSCSRKETSEAPPEG